MKRCRNLLLLAGFSLSLVAAIVAQSKAKKIDDLIRPVAATNQFAGIVLASENGKIIYEKAFGMANAELKVANASNTRIGIASITKSMTWIILTRLVEERKLSLDDKLSKFIPDFPNGDKITVAILSQHRSGIPHQIMPDEMVTRPYTAADLAEKATAVTLAFDPGSQRMYSSAGYSVLARVLEIASGETYGQLLKSYVFDPARMTDTLDWDSASLIDRRGQDYLRNEKGYVNAPIKDYSFLVGAGSVIGTAADLHRFGMAVVEGKFGEQVKTDQIRDNAFSTNGSTNGHRAYLEVRGDKSYGLIVLSNMGSGAFEFVQRGVAEILQGKEPTVKTLTIPKFNSGANKDLREFPGSYKRTDGGNFDIQLRDGYLWSADNKMHPVKPDCFFDFKFYGNACFSRDEAGKVSGLRWSGLTFELVGTRVN